MADIVQEILAFCNRLDYVLLQILYKKEQTMTRAAQGYSADASPYMLAERTDFFQIRLYGRLQLPEKYWERFITDIYEAVLEEPRNYTHLLHRMIVTARKRSYPIAENTDAESVCEVLWNEIGSDVIVGELRYKNYIAIFKRALRECPSSKEIRYS